MGNSKISFKVGTRPSSLALTQTRGALDRIEGMLEGVVFEMTSITSVGDTDRTTDLRESPADFFTRELDAALLRGEVDLAVHSAKDLPDPMPDGIDWFWLPWREEPRDVLILPKGKTVSDLPDNPVIGVSSERRAAYCTRRFPNGIQKPIRGNIEERIAQVDTGEFDIVVMAAAALVRLGLEERIAEWIPLEELEVPEGQGYLAVTFRKGDERMAALRNLFVQSVTFAGAGVGSRELCTIATLRALQRCDLCLYDSLIDHALLEKLPPEARAIDVGKRCGAHSKEQHETTRLICEYARQSNRVVRLKGGDPGIFGRLAEETEALETLGIPYRVIPGISALQAATTGTGMLFTRRNISRGFAALTPRKSGGALASCNAAMRNQLPAIFYMSIKAIDHVAQQLLEDGWSPETPAAIVYNAGGESEKIIKTTLAKLQSHAQSHCIKQPGLVIVGEITAYSYNTDLGALRGRRILLSCSEALQEKAAALVHDVGGHPIRFPLIRLECRQGLLPRCNDFDWLVATSPSAVRVLMQRVERQKMDLRSFPKIMVCGRGTAKEFERYGLYADACPETVFSAESLVELARKTIKPGEKILRVRSDKAGPDLADALRETGAEVEDAVIYNNHRIEHDNLPEFDVVFFASASATESFIDQWGVEALAGKTISVIGNPTARALEAQGIKPDIIARKSTIPGAIQTLVEFFIGEELCSRKPD
ncbi:MAG: uroporphyrinogen-III C-methyltransferase [Verrucomicrobiota bacterium]